MMAQQRLLPPRLAVPPRPSLQPQLGSAKTARIYPTFTPTSSKSAFLYSPTSTPTPSKRSRAPQGPLWLFTFLHLLSFYLLSQWLSNKSSPPSLVIFTLVSFVVAAFCLNIIYRPWKGRRIPFSQCCLLFISGTLLSFSYYLCFQGLLFAGPLETVFTGFAGFLATKVLLDSSHKRSETIRKARGLIALLLGVFFLSHGWARVSCSPLAIDASYTTRIKLIDQPANCFKISSMLAPFLGGVFSAFQQMMGTKTALKNMGKKRIQVLSYAMGSLALFPIAILQLAVRFESSPLQVGSSFYIIGGIVAFGIIITFFRELYAEEKLFLPVHSLKMFQIVACCVCGLELLFGLDISLVGFAFCCVVLALGVQELCMLDSQLSWDELEVSADGSVVFSSWIRRPLQHIFSDAKARKIAIFLLINTGFMFVEFFYGFLRNSLGLISDACHMLFDCAALAIGLYASYISRLPANIKFNYGYGRFEVVSGYANAVLLVLVASLIVLESIERILEPPEISTESLLVVSVGGLLVNMVGLIFFHEEHHHAHAHSGHSCSHSHSSHNSPHVSESTFKDSEVALSTVTSDGGCKTPFHNQDQPVASSNGDMYSSKLKNEGLNSYHSTLQKDENQNSQHSHHQYHDHHVCQSHFVHSSLEHNNHQKLSLEHGIDHKQIDPLFQDHQYDEDQAHTPFHSHPCNSPHHECHASEHHHFEGNAHQQNDCKSGMKCEHIYGHTHNGAQHDGQHVHGHNHHHLDDSSLHHLHHGNESSDGNGHKCQNLDHSHAHIDDEDCHNHGDGHHHHMDHNMYGIFLHVLADTLGSVGVVISTLLIKYKGWLITDPACSIFLSILIISSVVPLLRNSAEILLQRAPRYNEKSFKEAIKRIRAIHGVQNLGCVHLWSFTNTEVVGSLHVQLAAGSDRQEVQKTSLKILRKVGIKDLTLQIEEGS